MVKSPVPALYFFYIPGDLSLVFLDQVDLILIMIVERFTGDAGGADKFADGYGLK